ncbi:MAG TPA: glycosyltransferase [Thermoanaerobaculia bacterium]|jgi:glycosyltransferase involved in cell wall biosynthesis|nr:glycosyltransferase [Thermoanaerobaculia bacterium]
MRVAFVMPGVGVVARGAEAFVVELCQGLAALPGFAVHLFCRGPAPVPHTRIRALPRDQPLVDALYRATRLGRKAFDSLYLDPQSLEWYTAALAALPHLWRGGFDAVVMEGGLVGAWLCRLLRRCRGVPFVDIAHGVDPKWEGAFARQRPDRVVTFTAAAAEMVRARAPGAAVVVIPHGIDLGRWQAAAARTPLAPKAPMPPQAPMPPMPSMAPLAPLAPTPPSPPAGPPLPHPRVLCVGAVDAHKRMHLAVEAVARLPAGGSLTVLGEGPEAAALDRLAAGRLGAGRYLRRVVAREEMPLWYGAADCFTLPSRTESFGLVYLEALACGLPVVAPDDAVRREVIGGAGLFCDVTDAGAYSEALAAALSRDWGELPRRRAERFPIAATVTAYADLFTSLRPAGAVPGGGRGGRPAGRDRS